MEYQKIYGYQHPRPHSQDTKNTRRNIRSPVSLQPAFQRDSSESIRLPPSPESSHGDIMGPGQGNHPPHLQSHPKDHPLLRHTNLVPHHQLDQHPQTPVNQEPNPPHRHQLSPQVRHPAPPLRNRNPAPYYHLTMLCSQFLAGAQDRPICPTLWSLRTPAQDPEYPSSKPPSINESPSTWRPMEPSTLPILSLPQPRHPHYHRRNSPRQQMSKQSPAPARPHRLSIGSNPSPSLQNNPIPAKIRPLLALELL